MCLYPNHLNTWKSPQNIQFSCIRTFSFYARGYSTLFYQVYHIFINISFSWHTLSGLVSIFMFVICFVTKYFNCVLPYLYQCALFYRYILHLKCQHLMYTICIDSMYRYNITLYSIICFCILELGLVPLQYWVSAPIN